MLKAKRIMKSWNLWSLPQRLERDIRERGRPCIIPQLKSIDGQQVRARDIMALDPAQNSVTLIERDYSQLSSEIKLMRGWKLGHAVRVGEVQLDTLIGLRPQVGLTPNTLERYGFLVEPGTGWAVDVRSIQEPETKIERHQSLIKLINRKRNLKLRLLKKDEAAAVVERIYHQTPRHSQDDLFPLWEIPTSPEELKKGKAKIKTNFPFMAEDDFGTNYYSVSDGPTSSVWPATPPTFVCGQEWE